MPCRANDGEQVYVKPLIRFFDQEIVCCRLELERKIRKIALMLKDNLRAKFRANKLICKAPDGNIVIDNVKN